MSVAATQRAAEPEAGAERIRVSICICTRNRPESLARTLDSIGSSSVAPIEVIVSDDSTDDRTWRLIEQSYPRVVYRTGPRQGLGANRNAAAELARGGVVLFLDDDCLLDDRFLERALAALHGDADAEHTIVTGRELKNEILVSASDQSFLGYQNRPYAPGAPMSSVVINAALFPREMFEKVQFDERLIYGYDEIDLTTRASAAGYRIVECAEAVNHHFPSPVNRDYYARHAIWARLYVTFKRYRDTERRPVKAVWFLMAASTHALITMPRHEGLPGLRAAPAVLREALAAITSRSR